MLGKLKSLFAAKTTVADAQPSSAKREGDEHLKHGRLDEAVQCYLRELSAHPDNADACVGLGFALSEQGKYADAQKPLLRALDIAPTNVDAHYILGTIAKNQDDAGTAIERFTRAVELKPDFEFAHRDLVRVLFQSGQVERAKDALRKAIAALPQSIEFQLIRANAFKFEDNYPAAADCYARVLEIDPGFAEGHKLLGDALGRCGYLDRAIDSYRKAVWFDPNLFEAHIGLGDAMQAQGKLADAATSYESAAAIRPESAIAQIGLGCILESEAKVDEAIARFRRAVELEPAHAAAHQYLGNALLAKGATQDAIACFEETVRLDPASGLQHLIAALSGGESERAPSKYVEQLFDQYADKFDTHLVRTLSYSVPERAADTLRPYFAPNGEKWKILDLGCGTGLSGVAVASFAREVVGVDLSAKMLDKARERNLYQRLEQGDLLTVMQREVTSSFDVVLSADVFVYIGKLDELAQQVHRILRPDGFFAFSVESLDALPEAGAATSEHRDYRLNVTGRYAHARAYLERMAAASGFYILSTTEIQSRLDRGTAVQGYLALWQRPANA